MLCPQAGQECPTAWEHWHLVNEDGTRYGDWAETDAFNALQDETESHLELLANQDHAKTLPLPLRLEDEPRPFRIGHGQKQ